MKFFFSILTSVALFLNVFSTSYAQEKIVQEVKITDSIKDNAKTETQLITEKTVKNTAVEEKKIKKPTVKIKPTTEVKTIEKKPVVEAKTIEQPTIEVKPIEKTPAVEAKTIEQPTIEVKPIEKTPAVEAKTIEQPTIEVKPIEKTPAVEAKTIKSTKNNPFAENVVKKPEIDDARAKYLIETKDAQKDDRKELHKKNKEREYNKTMENAELDSDLVLNRYDNKQFIKTKIEEVAKAVVKKEVEAKKTISEQMGAIGSKRISVSIDETVSIKDAIMEVSNLAGIDIEIDPNVEGSIIISVKNTKVADVLERMADLAQLNISVRENVVRFTANKPFTKNYNIAFIDSMSSATNNTQSTSGVGVNNQNNNVNPYNNQMLGNNTNNMPNNGMNNGMMNNGMNSGVNGIGASSPNSLYSNTNAMQSNPSMWIEFENGLKYIVSQKKDTTYSINKQAGVVTLRAPLIIQKEVEEYIDRVKKVATAQILVEVRLVEVQLNDEFSTGINFSRTGAVGVTAPFSSSSTTNALSSTPFALTFSQGGLTAAVQFLQSFGTTKAIASPRLNVMNNQKSRLSFAKDQVYFSLQPQLQNAYNTINGTTNSSNPIIVQSTIHTIPVGIILELQATADIEKNEITMNIHPVLSSIVSSIPDPAATFLSSFSSANASASTITNSIPIIEKKELNSTLRIKSGEIMVIGGFNQEKTVVQRIGIPYLKDIPYLRLLFGRSTNSVYNVETVIFIKATIITPENSIGDDDTKFYNDFA